MRTIPAGFDPTVVAQIDGRLADVARDHGVALTWAIESGSRAWGFPSPDSDYDCRFFFVRSAASYLSPWRARDVIETPLDAVLDVNGWDLIKTVRLLVSGNAVALEWLRSPWVYSGDVTFRDALLEFAADVVDRNAVGRHYAHVGARQLQRHGLEGQIRLKTIFYALRPAVTVQWLKQHPSDAMPPMDLPTLLAETSVPPDVEAIAHELVTLKAETRELGSGEVPAVLGDYIKESLEEGLNCFEDRVVRDEAAVRGIAADFFRRTVAQYQPV